MATTVAAPRRAKVHPDRYFFPAMCALVLVIVWLGFSKTYYGVGMVRAHLPSPIIHVHAVVFTLWLVTLVVQTGLVTARKVKLHMAIGLWGFALAAVMVVIGLASAVNALHRDMSPPGSGLSALTFFVVPVSAMATFSILAAWSYAVRRKPDQHKRLILIATLALLDAAIGRFPYTLGPIGPLGQTLILLTLLAMVVMYDLISRKAIHRVTWMAALLVAVENIVRIPLAQTAPWQAFARMIHG